MNLKEILNSQKTGKTNNYKRVELPSGKKMMMPEHVNDYMEDNAVRRTDFTTENLNQPFARNYFKKSKKRSAYMSETPQTEKIWASGKIRRD